jgi:ubiquitin carboxyl-terminal hydrolase 1
METLEDVNCRSCSLHATADRLQEQIDAADHTESADIIKMRNILHLIRERIASNRIEEPIDPDIQLTKVLSPKSTKQVMFAKPPKCLCLHISRSAFHSSGAVYKNTCQVTFPEILDLTPYCTNSDLKVNPDMPMSSPSEHLSGTDTRQHKYQYKLMSTIVHYGSHNFGHFIAYKRRLERCGCRSCINITHKNPGTSTTSTQHDWYRLSDEKVDTCSVQDVLKANPYMLIYELIEDEPSEPEMPVMESIRPPLTNNNLNLTPTFKKSPLHSQLTNSSIHKLSMCKTVSATIQATALSGSKIRLPDSFESGIQIN